MRVSGTRFVVSGYVAHDLSATYLAVAHDIEKSDNVWAATEILENLDFSLYLLLLDGLEDLDDAFLVVDDVDALEHLRVLSPAW